MNKKTLGIGMVTLVALSGLSACKNSKNTPKHDYYTYNTYLETKPKTWNNHTWQTNDESYIQGFCENGLYDVILDMKTKDTYEVVPEMASEMPVDALDELTDEDYDNYGYTGNVKPGMIWDIALNEEACWEDGTKINADDYLESMKRQLDPKMVNFRADSYYASSLVLCNAERYFKQGRETMEALFDYIDKSSGNFISDDVLSDGYYYFNIARWTPYVASVFSGTSGDESLYTVLNQRSQRSSDAVELAAQRITDAAQYYCFYYVTHQEGDADWDKWKEKEKYTKPKDVTEEMMNHEINLNEFDDKDVYVRSVVDNSDDSAKVRYSRTALENDLKTVVGELGNHRGAYGTGWCWKLPLFGLVYNDDSCEFSQVGIKKVDDYKIRLYLKKSISALDLEFSLSGNWLVKTDLYDKLKVVVGGLVATKYASESVSNYMSYGPYKLTKYEYGKSIYMEKNEKWYGYHDGKHENQFQMDAIKTTVITDHNTVRQEFEKGNLDDFSMNKTDMKTYGNSSRKTTTYESYTQKISFNSNRSKLLSRQSGSDNKTVLANDAFRKGLSLSLDRNNFASQTTAGSKGFTGLLNDLYLVDAEKGTMYRSTEQAKGVYQQVYGELGGDPYADGYEVKALDEKSNGYNFQMATKYVAQGIKEELQSTESGHLTNGNNIKLEFRVYDTESETTQDMLTFIRGAFTKVLEAAKAKLADEGINANDVSIEIRAEKDENHYDTAKNGGYDMIFSTWGGAAINPYGLMQVYCDATFDSTCEYGIKGKQKSLNLTFDSDGDGVNETKSIHDWYAFMNDITEPEDHEDENYEKVHNQRITILAMLEAYILNRFEAVPLVARGTSSLTSFKVENATSTYVNLVGYGGVRFMTFEYDDYEWNEFIHSKDYSADLYKD